MKSSREPINIEETQWAITHLFCAKHHFIKLILQRQEAVPALRSSQQSSLREIIFKYSGFALFWKHRQMRGG